MGNVAAEILRELQVADERQFNRDFKPFNVSPDAPVERPTAVPGGPARRISVSDEILAEMNGSEEQAGMDTAMAGQGSLGKPGMESLPARFAVGQANNRKEALLNFQKFYPKGDLIFSPNLDDPDAGKVPGTTMLFREDPSQPYRKVDAGLLERFEPVADLVDLFAEDLGTLAGEALTTVRAKGLNVVAKLLGKVPGVRSTVGRVFLGAAGGEQGQQFVQSAAGVQAEPLGEQAGRSVVQGAAALTGLAAGATAAKAINTVLGAGAINVTPGAREAMAAGERLDLPDLIPPQVTDNPFVRKLGGQSGALVPTVERYMNSQKEAAERKLASMRNPSDAARLSGDLEALEAGERSAILGRAATNARGTGKKEAGLALQEGVNAWDDTATLRVAQKYADARAIETPEYDLSPLGKVFAQIEAGIPFAGRTTQQTERAPSLSGRDAFVNETTQVQLPGGKASGPVDATVKSIMDEISRADPGLPPQQLPDGTIVDATEQLRAWRTRLWDLKTISPFDSPTPERRKQAREASAVYRSITKTLENPVNASPEFKGAWKAANDAAREQFETREKLLVMQIAKSESPRALAQDFMQPGVKTADNLEAVKAVVSADKFGKVQDAFKTDLLENARGDRKALISAMDGMDREALDMLMSPGEQQAFRVAGKALERLDSVGIQRALQTQTKYTAMIDDLVNRKDTAGIDEFKRMIDDAGGLNSPVGKSVRAALVDSIFNKVTKVEKGVPEIDFKAMNGALTQYKESGALKFLTPQDVTNITDLRNYMDFVRNLEEVGGGIQAGAAIAGAREFSLAAFRTILEAVGTGRLLTGEFGRYVLIGRGSRTQKPYNTVKAMAQVLAFAGDDLEAGPK